MPARGGAWQPVRAMAARRSCFHSSIARRWRDRPASSDGSAETVASRPPAPRLDRSLGEEGLKRTCLVAMYVPATISFHGWRMKWRRRTAIVPEALVDQHHARDQADDEDRPRRRHCIRVATCGLGGVVGVLSWPRFTAGAGSEEHVRGRQGPDEHADHAVDGEERTTIQGRQTDRWGGRWSARHKEMAARRRRDIEVANAFATPRKHEDQRGGGKVVRRRPEGRGIPIGPETRMSPFFRSDS